MKTKFNVEMIVCYKKIINVYAEDETAAEEKALEVCNNFTNIHSCAMHDIREDETGY